LSNYLLIPTKTRTRLLLDTESFYTLSQARAVAKRINSVQTKPTSAAELYALGLIADIMEYIADRYFRDQTPNLAAQLVALWRKKMTAEDQAGLHRLLVLYKVESDTQEKSQLVDGDFLIRLWINFLLAHNPAIDALSESFFKPLQKYSGVLKKTIQLINALLEKQPPEHFSGLTLPELFKSAEKSGSLYEQLIFIIKNWGLQHTPFEARILLGLDLYKEEAKLFDPAHFKSGPSPMPDYQSSIYDEPEAFTADLNWMPHLVLIAKSAYVWLDQLSKAYHFDIHRLDQIPDAELNRLANFGFTGLWLIGLWERSTASQKIKRINGNPEAVASAYALKSYEIAEDLGGWGAYQNLKDRAWQRGIRLASDMVPNHMGIDSDWLIQHPDWFISRMDSPYPNHTFNGTNLSDHQDVGIFIEDGYWFKSDASVVFKRIDYKNNDVRYIYHGNDGTGMPWNDTAQLNYLLPHVREAVIQTILHVARAFPIIRFDAAMTLAKKHYQRLWFPQPGSGGDIPTRSEYAMSTEEFNRVFPHEFWREVVDRVQQEVPDTLLLAEAFWMMEGYFVRTLGMHRVYNSAFMNMLKNEDNAEYREIVINVLQFNPQILKRYVNFMNNPDEETAVAQFGKGDKYFGVCTLMCTMPGLPMFGHGQIEGFSERYGMEYKRAYKDEQIDTELRDRHLKQITPLLKNRPLYSEVDNFIFYDFKNGNGHLESNVFCYSNRFENQRALIIYHNRYASTAGWVKHSVTYKDAQGADKNLSLTDGLSLSSSANTFTIFKDLTDGLEYLKPNRELFDNGFYAEMHAYGLYVFSDIREVVDSPERPYAALYQKLNGAACASVDEDLMSLVLQPVHSAFKNVLKILNDNQLTLGFFRNIPTSLKKIDHIFKEAGKTIYAHQNLNGDIPSGYVQSLFDDIDKRINGPLSKNLTRFILNGLYAGSATAIENRKRILILTFIKMLFSDNTPDTIGEQIKHWHLDALFKQYVNDDNAQESIMLLATYGEILFKDGQLRIDKNSPVNLMEAIASFLRINTFEGVTYFNRERWIDLLDIGLLSFVMFDQGSTSRREQKKKWNVALKDISRLKKEAVRAGFDFLRLLVKINEV